MIRTLKINIDRVSNGSGKEQNATMRSKLSLSRSEKGKIITVVTVNTVV